MEDPILKKIQKSSFALILKKLAKYGAGGIGRLYINDKKVGEGEIPHTVRFIYALDETFDIRIDSGTPLTDDYKSYSRFTGTIEKVIVDLLGKRQVIDPETKAKIIMKKQ